VWMRLGDTSGDASMQCIASLKAQPPYGMKVAGVRGREAGIGCSCRIGGDREGANH
jgi:hypothetical protein